jgi:chromosome segregation ATPase
MEQKEILSKKIETNIKLKEDLSAKIERLQKQLSEIEEKIENQVFALKHLKATKEEIEK